MKRIGAKKPENHRAASESESVTVLRLLYSVGTGSAARLDGLSLDTGTAPYGVGTEISNNGCGTSQESTLKHYRGTVPGAKSLFKWLQMGSSLRFRRRVRATKGIGRGLGLRCFVSPQVSH